MIKNHSITIRGIWGVIRWGFGWCSLAKIITAPHLSFAVIGVVRCSVVRCTKYCLNSFGLIYWSHAPIDSPFLFVLKKKCKQLKSEIESQYIISSIKLQINVKIKTLINMKITKRFDWSRSNLRFWKGLAFPTSFPLPTPHPIQKKMYILKQKLAYIT